MPVSGTPSYKPELGSCLGDHRARLKITSGREHQNARHRKTQETLPQTKKDSGTQEAWNTPMHSSSL